MIRPAAFLCALILCPLAAHAAGQDPGQFTPQNAPQMFDPPQPAYQDKDHYKKVCDKKRDKHGKKVRVCRYKKR